MWIKAFVFIILILGCYGMLDQGLPKTAGVTTKASVGSSDPNLLHQLIMQETSIRLELEKQITSLQTSVNNMQKDLLQKDQDISMLKAQNQEFQHKISQDSKENAVIFSSLLTHNLENIPNGQVIIFDKTSINIGNGYNTNNGIFTAPVSGAYQFSLTIGGNVVNTHANMVHNGHIVGHLYADHFRDGQYGRASLTLALHLNKGDQVWNVDPDGQIHQVIIGSHGSMPISIFTGHLVLSD